MSDEPNQRRGATENGDADKHTVSDQLLDRLAAWRVHRIFGYPGDGINGVMGALRRAGDRFDFVRAAHEELAGLMATAHAKFTGELGVCLCTSGPGAIHMLNGLYDAKLDHAPVLAIIGQQPVPSLGGSMQQEVDLKQLCSDVAAYVEMIATPEQLRHVVDRAARTAIGERTVTVVILPHDVQRKEPVEHPAHEHGRLHSGVGYVAPRMLPPDDQLRRAADVLNAGKKVAVLIGAGAMHATDEVIQAADVLGAGVAKALLGKTAVPDDLPFVTGSVGWLGTAPSNRMMKECDTLFMIGSAFPYTEFLPKEGQARGVQIDIAPMNLDLRYPMEVALAGDSADTLRALLPLLQRKEDRAWRAGIERQVEQWWNSVRKHAHTPADPINPKLVAWELSERLPDGAIVTGDSGSSAVWTARDLRMRRGMMYSVSGGLATMGSAVPYAVAAKFAYPERLVVAFAGDGAMQMSGINSLIDVARYWRSWKDPRLVVLVLNNKDLNFVTWEQRAMEGEPRYERSQALLDIRYAEYAKLLGLHGIRVEEPDDVARAWEEALAANCPVVIDALVDPAVPTLPPELTPEVQEHLAEAFAKEPNAEELREQLVEQGIGAGSE